MQRQNSEDVIGAARPFTGKEYLESLRDEREVYIYGERVADVTTHPAFRNAARTMAKLYDALHDPKQRCAGRRWRRDDRRSRRGVRS
jgi:4-hydroxyphenylacetate 3-monooxygenase